MYLVLPEFASSPISLLVTINASAFSFYINMIHYINHIIVATLPVQSIFYKPNPSHNFLSSLLHCLLPQV